MKSSSAAITTILLLLDHWPTYLNDLVEFMNESFLHIKVGLVILGSLA